MQSTLTALLLVSLNLPVQVASIIEPFAAVFSKRVWCQAQILVVGAILTTGKRTITSVLGVMGLTQEEHFQNYHRVLNRAVWSSLEASRILLIMLVTVFVPCGPIIMGMDDTIERRKGEKIKAKGIYRDPVRSSHSHFVKVSGLRWVLPNAISRNSLGVTGMGVTLLNSFSSI